MAKAVQLNPRAKKQLEKLGYTVEKVEYWNSFAFRRIDFLGVGDLIALKEGEALIVQVTSRANISSRRNKALASDKLKLWLTVAGCDFIIMGFDKKENGRWRSKTVDINNNLLEQFGE